jgi:hypothetical protein
MKANIKTTLLVVLLLLLPITVFADNVFVDGDGLAPVANNNTLNLGEICLGSSAASDVLLAIQRTGQGQVYANSAIVTVSAGQPTNLAIGVIMPDPSTISLPSDWVDASNNTMSDSLTSTVSVTGNELGLGNGSITFSATGAKHDTGDLTRTEDLTVFWEVVDCPAWTLTGFYQPVNMSALNTVKGGSTVPLKFNVYDGDTELTDISVIASFTTQVYACNGGLPAEPVEITTTGNTSLRYDATEGQFIQNWKTPRSPGACYLVTMATNDGSTIVAEFQLK